jgi:REP element-mobilizing transposase RayT
MKFDPRIHHRRSIRLKGYDYRQAGGYFVTMVTQGRDELFGEVVNGEMILNDAGEMIVRWWLELPNKFPNVNVNIFVVMPNHFHGIIFIIDDAELSIVGDDLRVVPGSGDSGVDDASKGKGEYGGEHGGSPQRTVSRQSTDSSRRTDSPQKRQNAPLSQMIQWFKTMTTNEYIRGVKNLGWKPFNGKVWQRDYYEHIIRNQSAADRIASYIESNPARWHKDKDNPKRTGKTLP